MKLSDQIELFIKELMNDGEGMVDLQRNELAGHFGCAPSQINYVLATRFTVDHGYIIESYRGGGGFIRLVRISRDKDDMMLSLLTERIGGAISNRSAKAIITDLLANEVISEREAAIMVSAVSSCLLPLSAAAKDALRAGTMRSMLLALIADGER